MRRHTRILALAAALLTLAACQSPMETPPTTERSVTVHVQDGGGRPLPYIPVLLFERAEPDGEPRAVGDELTDRAGNASFSLRIPTTGRALLVLVGDDNTGRVQLEANLLCRDTVMIVRLVTEELPCNTEIERTVRISNVCAPLSTGERFTDSASVIFQSGCDVPMEMTLAGPENSADLTLRLFDGSGREINARTFALQALGRLTLRAIASPSDSSLHVYRYTVSGIGAGGASVTLRLTVEVEGRNCNVCSCPDSTIVLDFGTVQAGPPGQYAKTLQALLPLNACRFDRVDDLLHAPAGPRPFSVTAPDAQVTGPGQTSMISVTFSPPAVAAYEDTVLISHTIGEENRSCTTRVVLRGNGCGPECRIVEENLTGGPTDFTADLGRVRVYESTRGAICFENVGACGTVTLSAAEAPATAGFRLSPATLSIGPGEVRCFDVVFEAEDAVVWPNGHGQPAVTRHGLRVDVGGCGEIRHIDVRVLVDTLPARFSRCVYQWDQNEHFGYNFTPVEGKGEDHFDPDPLARQLSDLVVQSVAAPVSADVLIRSGWKFIKANVSESEFNFTDMSSSQNGWTRGEYLAITTGPFNASQSATLLFRSVYSIRIERGGVLSYACVRVREVSVDPDGKYKICFDVLYPMILE